MVSSFFNPSNPSNPSRHPLFGVRPIEESDTLMPETPLDEQPPNTEPTPDETPPRNEDTLTGTPSRVVVGSEEDNFLFGFEGNDTLLGLGGNDVILGGAGDNIISGGSGDDILRGGAGNDSLVGGSGDDILGGDEGRNRLQGGSGNNIFLLQPRRQLRLNLTSLVPQFADFEPQRFPLNNLNQLFNNPAAFESEQPDLVDERNRLIEAALENNLEPGEDAPEREVIIEDFDPSQDRLGLMGSLRFEDLEIRTGDGDEPTVEIRVRETGEVLARLLSDDPDIAAQITEETVVRLDEVQFTQERLQQDEAGDLLKEVTLERNRSSGSTIAVAVTSRVENGPDSNGEPERVWVIFGPTEREKTVQISLDESLPERASEVTLQLETPLGGASLGPQDQAVLELFQPEPVEPEPMLVNLQRVRPLRANEEAPIEGFEVTLVRSGDVTDAAAVNLQLSDAMGDASESLQSLRAEFAANRATTTVRLPLAADVAALERLRFSLADPSAGLRLGSDRESFFDLMPTPMEPAFLSFAESIFQVEEDGTPIMDVVLVRGGNLEQASQVTIAVSEGTLALPDSFAERLIPVSFEPGEQQKTITITGVQQADLEAPGTVNLSLSNPSQGTELIRPRTAILEVFPVEPPPPDIPDPLPPDPPEPGSPGEIAFTSANYFVEEDGNQFAEISLQRLNGSQGEVGVTVIPFSQTAVAPGDFDDTPIPVTFADGQTQQVVRLPIVDDSLIEPPETLGLVLANPTNGASLGPRGSATLTIAPSNVPALFSFEGVGHLNPVSDFYGAQGVQFSENALALLSATGLREMGVREGFGGNFETAPSGETAVSYNQGDRLWFTVQEGFAGQVSFAYASPFQEHQVTVFSGPDGSGEVLAQLSLAETPQGEFPRAYDVFETVTLPFAGVARSVAIGSAANKILLDDIVVG
ncbi:Calx-beta domain-containing protein [Sodalinema gerasimenkoae]|uniref:Calx-beta domain-containing protein n=1 Tax=Sodalinema gerasimenkoae TaxID=2862348 RepID=UPI001358258F|nr:Calx-beta domain-containing protein [Sodalinema gerasimenkoae]